MGMKIKYWLIYADCDGRKAMPFWDVGIMERYIENNKNDLIVINKTKVIK